MKLSLIVATAILVTGCIVEHDPDPTPAPPPQAALTCGTVDIQCNCAATTAYPGQVTYAPRCESGQHIFGTCGYCPGGGYAWYAQCYCRSH